MTAGRLTVPFRPRNDDGSRLLRHYGGGPDREPHQNLTALVTASRKAYNDVNGLVRLGHGPIIVDPDATLQPLAGITWQGAGPQTVLRSSAFETQPIFTTTNNDWHLRDLTLDGGRDLTAVTGGPSIVVVNAPASGWTFEGRLTGNLNNGFLARGPGCRHFRIVARDCIGSGLAGQLGGGHMIALTGDGLDSPFDCEDYYVWLDGKKIFNGGLNAGSSRNFEAHVRVFNDWDPVAGPPNSGYAALRLANGSRGGYITVWAIACGRGFRSGPTDDIDGWVIAERCSFEGSLDASTVYVGSNWRGGRDRLRQTITNCCLRGGREGIRSKSHGPSVYDISVRNEAGLTALNGTVTTYFLTDDDLYTVETTRQKVLLIEWDTFDDYVFPILDAGGGSITWQAVKDDGTNTVAATVTCANTNNALAAAINALGGIFRAHTINADSGATLELSAAGRKGPMDYGITIADVASALTAPLNAGENTSTVTVASGAAIADSPNGETHYAFSAFLSAADLIDAPVEEVLVTARTAPGGNSFTISRAQNGTTALAWPIGAFLYAHPSKITLTEGSTFERLANAVNFIGPAPRTRISRAISTDETTSRGSGTKLFVPPGVSRAEVTGTTEIDYIYPCFAGRELTLVFQSAGCPVKHGAGNLNLWGQRDYASHLLSELTIVADKYGHTFNERTPQSRPGRVVVLGNISGAVNLPLLPGDRHVIVTATLTGATTITPTNVPTGTPVAIQLLVVQGGAGSFSLTIAGAKTAGAAALNLSTAVGALDDVTVLIPGDGGAAHALRAGKAMA